MGAQEVVKISVVQIVLAIVGLSVKAHLKVVMAVKAVHLDALINVVANVLADVSKTVT